MKDKEKQMKEILHDFAVGDHCSNCEDETLEAIKSYALSEWLVKERDTSKTTAYESMEYLEGYNSVISEIQERIREE